MLLLERLPDLDGADNELLPADSPQLLGLKQFVAAAQSIEIRPDQVHDVDTTAWQERVQQLQVQLQEQAARFEAEMEGLRNKFRDEMQALNANHEKRLRDMAEEHDRKIAELKVEGDERMLQELKATYAKNLADSQRKHAASMEQMRAQLEAVSSQSPWQRLCTVM